MNTTKKLIIGTAALLAVVIGMQAEEKIWERYTLDYKDSGIEKLELRHAVYKADRIDLRNCKFARKQQPHQPVYTARYLDRCYPLSQTGHSFEWKYAQEHEDFPTFLAVSVERIRRIQGSRN